MGRDWPKVLDVILSTMTEHSLACQLETVFVCGRGLGGEGGGGPVLLPPKGHSAPDAVPTSQKEGSCSKAVLLGEGGICDSPIVAAPMAPPAPLTVGAGAVLLLD